MTRNIADKRPAPANRANEHLSNLVLEGGRKQHYDHARTRIPDAQVGPDDDRQAKTTANINTVANSGLLHRLLMVFLLENKCGRGRGKRDASPRCRAYGLNRPVLAFCSPA